MPETPWMTAEEAADYLRCSKSKIYRLVSYDDIPYHKQSGQLLFHRDQLDKWMESQRYA